jgi:hypothetical protein
MAKELTNSQRDELIEQYVELVVDNMDTKSLVQFVTEELTDYYEKLSDIELKEEVGNYDEELYDELVDNVTNEDDDEELTTQEQIDYIKSHLTSEDSNCMQTFIPGFHD